jgi:hypothetical protein
MSFYLRIALLAGVSLASLFSGILELRAATETQKFNNEADALSTGWIGENNRNLSFGTDFGFSETNKANGTSGAGEAGGIFPRRNQPIGYYADLSVGHLNLNVPLQASGRVVFEQGGLDGGIRIGWFNTSDLTNPLPAFAGVQIAEQNRHQAVVILNDRTGRDAIFQSGGVGPVSVPFSLSWNPATRSITATIGSVTNFTNTMTDAQMALGSDFNAFGMYTGFTGSNNPSQQGRLWIDDLTYTSQDTTTPTMRINRYTGATRIVGSGGAAAIELAAYTASSNPANPPLESVWLPGNWNSLTDQNGGGWTELSATAQQLRETNSTGSKTMNPGSQINLGNVYDVASANQDVSFSYSLSGETFARPGQVVFDGGLSLRVNKQSGIVTIQNNEALDFNFDGYVIQSGSGVLSAGSWTSLEQQTVAGWEKVASSDASELSELNLGESTLLNAGDSLNLGAAYSGGLTGAQDLRFTFSLAGGQEVLVGDVQYVTTLVGDYNSNGTVDAADYTIWRDTLNSTTDLRADGNGNHMIDAGDYQQWKSNFGNHSGSGASDAAFSVPEPSTAPLLLLAVAANLTLRPRRRKA